INIPPYEADYKIKIARKINKTMSLVLVGSHMHFRGKASSIMVVSPNGHRKRIFGLDPFTKTFERLYVFKKPYVVFKGSTIECNNWFDNSAKNPANPAPEKHVTFGNGFEDEMSMCFFQWLVPAGQGVKHNIFYQN
ncbi:MAG: hypothetical protein OXN83_02180, partial [Oligoflexia bacterium]|nr:hypothetical protein [Oligoflexia bacterium]